MADATKMKPTENHPDNGTEPSMSKAQFDGIGTFIDLKQGSANSANSKSGKPFGSGGE